MSKTHVITLAPSGVEFEANTDETILEAALRHGHTQIPYCCTTAICGTCRAKLLTGEITYDTGLDIYGLTSDEIKENWVLLCSARPLTDVIVDLTPSD